MKTTHKCFIVFVFQFFTLSQMDRQTTGTLIHSLINDLDKIEVKPLSTRSVSELIELLERDIDSLYEILKLLDRINELKPQEE